MAQAYFNFIQNSPFQDLKQSQLLSLARENKVKYYYSMNKLDLVITLTNLGLSVHNNTNSKKSQKLTQKL